MAIALVNTTHFQTNVGANPQVITIPSTGAGALIVVSAQFLTANPITSVTDNQGNTYTLAANSTSKSGPNIVSANIWYSFNSTAGVTSVSVNFGSNSALHADVSEWSGVNITSPLDSSGHLDNQAATSDSPSLTTTQAGDLMIAIGHDPANGNTTGVNAPFTLLAGSGGNEGTAYLITTSPGSYQATFTTTTFNFFGGSGAAFFSGANLLKSLSDSTSGGSDTLVKQTNKILAEALSGSDGTAVKQLSRTLQEPALVVEDAEGKITARRLSENVTTGEWVGSEKNPAQNVWETE